MADTNSPISQAFAPGTNYWDNPANWAKPVQGNQFTTGTQALDSMGSINSENPAATGFSASSQGATGGGFNPQGSVPNTAAGQLAANTTTGSQNSSVGNEASQINSSGQQQGDVIGQLNKANQAVNQGNAGQSSSGGGLSNFSNIVSNLGSHLGNSLGLSGEGSLTSQISNGFNELGSSVFGTGLSSSQSAAELSSFTPEITGTNMADFSSAETALDSGAGSLTSASASDLFGGAGIGAGIGSVYGMLTGLKGPNAFNADIGGAVGGLGGAAIGAELGSVVPGIGTVLGGVAGSIIGGLFGPGAATSDSGEAGALNATGGINQQTVVTGGKNPNSQTQQFVSSAVNQFGALSQSASKALGINFDTSLGFNAQDSTLHGGPWIAVQPMSGVAANGTGQISLNPSDASSVASAYYQALSYAATNSGYTDKQSLYNWFYGQPSQGANPTQFGSGVTIAPKGSTNNSGPIV